MIIRHMTRLACGGAVALFVAQAQAIAEPGAGGVTSRSAGTRAVGKTGRAANIKVAAHRGRRAARRGRQGRRFQRRRFRGPTIYFGTFPYYGYPYYSTPYYGYPYYRSYAYPYPYRYRYRYRGPAAGQCAYWSRRCTANWGRNNADYYGCMRYQGCRR